MLLKSLLITIPTDLNKLIIFDISFFGSHKVISVVTAKF